MSIRKAVLEQGFKQVLEPRPVQRAGYILDERGNEVQITSTMVRAVCHQLLKKCRHIKY